MTEQSSAAARLIRDKVNEAERRENEEDVGSDVFDEGMDPLAMLRELEANRATTSTDHVAAYRVVRQQQQKVRRRRTQGPDAQPSEEPEAPAPKSGRGRGGRGRGRPKAQQVP